MISGDHVLGRHRSRRCACVVRSQLPAVFETFRRWDLHVGHST